MSPQNIKDLFDRMQKQETKINEFILELKKKKQMYYQNHHYLYLLQNRKKKEKVHPNLFWLKK